MTTTTLAPAAELTTATPRWRPLLGTGALAGIAAATATTVVAAAARAADVPLAIDGEAIPLAGFANLVLVGTALGVVLARVIGRRRPFVMATMIATTLSCAPSLTVPDDTATKVVLVATHIIAATIVVPALARRLPIETDGGS